MARIIDTSTVLETSALDQNTKDWMYNGLDCCVTLEIRDELLPLLDNTTGGTYNFSMSLQAPVLEMTLRGLMVDFELRREVLANYQSQIARLDDQLTRIVRDGIGWPLAENTPAKGKQSEKKWWRSSPKLKSLFYDVMKLPPVRKRNAQGIFAPTTNRDALEKLDTYFIAQPVTRHMLMLRDLDKKRTFLQTAVDPDGKIRTSFNIGGTSTGRLSSSLSDFGTGGNLQNVDRELRSVFVAPRGYKFVNLDLEQGDARNVGAICWNAFVETHGEVYAGSYLNACESGDLHTYNSRLIWPELPWTGDLKFDKPIAERIFYRQDTYRQMSKKGGHGTNYYGTPRTMAHHLKVDTHIIDAFQKRYFSVYPVIGSYKPKDNDPDAKLPNWHNLVKRQLLDSHTITTLLGRRRRFFGRANDDATLREAIAYEPQSMTADEIDAGLLRVWQADLAIPLVQVHDSILFMIPEDREEELVPQLLSLMRTRIILKKGREFSVPTEAKTGWNWGDWDKDRNPDGVMKWKGSDSRKRQRPAPAQSVADFFA